METQKTEEKEVREQIAALTLRSDALRKQADEWELANDPRNSAEYKALEAKKQTLYNTKYALRTKIEEQTEFIAHKFLTNGSEPCYRRSGSDHSYWNNVRDGVLEAIKTELKVSLLTEDNITEIVKKLLRKELEQDKDYTKLINKARDNAIEISEVERKQESIYDWRTTSRKTPFDDELSSIWCQIRRLEDSIDPKKQKKVKMADLRETERDKITYPEVIDAIYARI